MQHRYMPLAAVLLLLGAEAASAQNRGGLFDLFGGSAPATAQAQWAKVPRAEMGCIERVLGAQRTSSKAYAQAGVMPNDPRLSQMREQCRKEAARQTVQPGAKPTYVVDGTALGARLKPESAAYREYRCMPSDEFAGFTWCEKRRQEKNRLGTVSSASSILHSQDGTAVYVNRSTEPATFDRGEIDKQIDALSTKYGERARVMRMEPTAGFDGTAVIAQWGQIELEPLGADELAGLAAGSDAPAGLRVDYLGDFARSAKLGLPVFRIAGGAGYVWSASADQKGRGRLRLLSSDASLYGQAVAAVVATPVARPAAQPTPPPNPEIAQAAKPEPTPEQPTTAGAVRTAPEAVGAATKVEPGEAPSPPAQLAAANESSQRDVTGQTRIATEGAGAQTETGSGETNYALALFPLVIGLIIVAAVAVFLLLRRRTAKSTPNLQPQLPIGALDLEIRSVTGEPAAEAIAHPHTAVRLEAS
jgi:hypothetical protein